MSEFVETPLGILPRSWQIKPLKETTIKIQDGTHFSPQTDEGPCLYLTSKNIKFGKFDIKDCGWISRQEHDSIYARCDVKFGDVLLTKDGANTGNACMNNLTEPFSLLSSVAFLRTDGVTNHSGFILQYLLSPIGQRRLKDLMSGNAIPRLTLQKIKAFKTPVPTADEQRRIATILTTLDEVIEATEKLVEKHQQIKAGLMHDLFTRGLWTRPELARGDHKGLPCEATAQEGQLRPTPEEAPGLYQNSPLGLIPKGWCAKQLPEVVDFWDGKRIPLKEDDRAEMEGDIPYYGASGIIDWIDRWLFDDELILLGEDGENIISRNLPLAFKVVGKCWINNHAHVMKPKSSQSIDYWTNYLEWRDYSRMTSGSAQPKITQSHLSRMHVAEPSEREQIAIAKRMDAVHLLIAEETTHLDKLRQQKQGLMHDLLTGRVRVKCKN